MRARAQAASRLHARMRTTAAAAGGARTRAYLCALVLHTCMPFCTLLLPAPHAGAQESTAEDALRALRDAVEHAQFARVALDARALLTRDSLCARERNDALEMLAIAQIAARDEIAARATLQELFTRDPNHRPRLRDPGPQVEAAFARAYAEPRASPQVPLSTTALRDPHGRTVIEVELGAGRDAVASVDVFARGEEAAGPVHVVADVESRRQVSVTLPALDPSVLAAPHPQLLLYVEARAPSGYVLGSDGTHDRPLKVQLERERAQGVPLRQRWWLWTSVSIVVAGVAVGGAIAAR